MFACLFRECLIILRNIVGKFAQTRNIRNADAGITAHVVSDAVHMQRAAIVNKAHDVLASSARFNLQPTETMRQLVGIVVNTRTANYSA